MSGTGVHATVRLAIARVGGQFTLSGVTDSNPAGPLVDLHGTDVAGGAHICADASASASRSGPTGLRTRCDLDTVTAAGQVFTVLSWVVQAVVWGLATFALAGLHRPNPQNQLTHVNPDLAFGECGGEPHMSVDALAYLDRDNFSSRWRRSAYMCCRRGEHNPRCRLSLLRTKQVTR